MILGWVNARREAIVPTQVRDLSGQAIDIEATIDTGFSGDLTYPLSLVTALQLPYVRTERFILGDNTEVTFDVYAATVVWDGQDRSVLVLATDTSPLVGMSLLHGFHLFVDVVDGGEVRITPRP